MTSKKNRAEKAKFAESLAAVDGDWTNRLPPHSPEAEQGVLGCVLAQVETADAAVGDCIEKFKGHNGAVFYDLRHQKLFEAMVELYNEKKLIDLITLNERLKNANCLEEVGGLAYIATLPDTVPSAAMLPHYLDIVYEKFMFRRILKSCGEVVGQIYSHAGEVDELLDKVEKTFLQVNADRSSNKELHAGVVIQSAIERIEHYHRGGAQMLGISTGFEYLDKMTCGMSPGQMIVYAARPGMGKTSLGMNIAEHTSLVQQIPTGVFSLEMTADELGARLLFSVAQGDYQRFRTGAFENEDIPKLIEGAKQIGSSKLWVDDTPGLNVMELRSKARRMVRQYGIKLFVIDYLQLMKSIRHYNNREQEVAEISTGIKSLAKELKVPIIVLAQFNREIDKDPNRPPRLSDLRESGSIEQDADLVGLLYKPKLKPDMEEALERRDQDWSKKFSRVNCLIAKQRNGPTGDVELEYYKSYMKFFGHKRPSWSERMPSKRD
jgi:replicative DNA helicase